MADSLMRYQRAIWYHEHPDEPVVLISEVDDEGWEVRKVEQFRDGSDIRTACAGEITGTNVIAQGEPPTRQRKLPSGARIEKYPR